MKTALQIYVCICSLFPSQKRVILEWDINSHEARLILDQVDSSRRHLGSHFVFAYTWSVLFFTPECLIVSRKKYFSLCFIRSIKIGLFDLMLAMYDLSRHWDVYRWYFVWRLSFEITLYSKQNHAWEATKICLVRRRIYSRFSSPNTNISSQWAQIGLSIVDS